jgi:hypothetical protein
MFGILIYSVPNLFPDLNIKLPSSIKIGGSSDYDLQIGLNPRS